MTRHRAHRPAGGFTLVELLISVAIVAVLASGAMAYADLAVRRGQEQELRTALRQIREAIDAYKAAADAGRIRRSADDNGYPPSLAALTEGVPEVGHPNGRKLYFLRRLPRDPMAEASLPAELTWGLRSYESDPADPRPGRDVFDVHSLSRKAGLGGQPYREW
jgi:general secretion pathway protein G